MRRNHDMAMGFSAACALKSYGAPTAKGLSMNLYRTPLLASCLAVTAICLTGCESPTGPNTVPDPPVVEGAPAAQAPVDVRLERPTPFPENHNAAFIGRVEAGEEVPLGFLSAGVVQELRVDVGDRVSKGQVLAWLESTDLDAAETAARQQVVHASSHLRRLEELYGDRYVSLAELESARTNAAVAQQELRRTKHALRYAQIVAPSNGTVLARHVRAGEVVAAGQDVLRVSGVHRAWLVRAEVPDRVISSIGVGQEASILIDGTPDAALGGRISRIAGAANASSGNLMLEVEILQPTEVLRSGMIARVQFQPSAGTTPLLSVPLGALLDVEGKDGFVFVERLGRAHRQKVTIGALANGRAEVVSGLKADANVVVAGASYVVEGNQVREAKR